MPDPLVLSVVAVASTAVVWAGSTLLESSSERLSLYFGLPPVVHGAVVVAIGSSFPELSSTVISTLRYGQFDLGVGAIVGSAIFNVLVIPGAAALLSDRPMGSNRDLVYKEAQFYMLSIAVLLLTFSFGVIYVESPDPLTATVTRPLALIPVGLYALYVFNQYQDTADHVPEVSGDGVDPLRQFGVLAVALVLIVVAVEGLVHAAVGFGELFGTPSFLWGLTVVAAGTSLPDAIISVRAARDDRPVQSLANVLGSNVFDLLVAIPAGVLIAGTATIAYGAAVPMMAYLTFATLVLFTMLRTDMTLSNTEAYGLLLVYVAFIAWMLAETMDATNLVPGV